jgi:hypothetical protein
LRSICPRQQLIDIAVGVTIDDRCKNVGQIRERVDVVQLACSIRDATVAQCSAPPSDPANNAFFRLSATGRMERSTVLLSSSMRPSSMKRVRPSQRDRAVADGRGELALLADQTEFCAQPRLERIDQGTARSAEQLAA